MGPIGRIELPTDTTYEAAALPLSYTGRKEQWIGVGGSVFRRVCLLELS